MSDTVMNAAKMMELLPIAEQELAFEFIKRLLLAWDPDFTKLTKEEELSLENAENSGFIDDSSIDWDNLSQIALMFPFSAIDLTD